MLRHFRRLSAKDAGFLPDFPISYICLYFPAPTSVAMTMFWVLEYDVDVAGNWRDFFLITMQSKADFIGANIQPSAS